MIRLLRAVMLSAQVLSFHKEYQEILNAAVSRERIQEFQDRHLSALLTHCYQQVPYYHELFERYEVVEHGAIHIERFRRLPPLTKEQIRNHAPELTARDLGRRRWFHTATGGSTGEPMRFIQDRDYVRWSRANNHYYYHDMLGIDRIVNREVRIWGNQRDVLTGGLELKKRLRDFAYNITFLNSFRMTPSQMKSYIDLINRVRPPIVNGYAGSLFELCRYARTTGVSFPTPRLLASSAETLTDEMRSEIESMFHLPVHDFYGSREAENLAAQCDARLYHQFLFSHVIEVVDERGEPVEEGEEGRIVITPLHNYSMPLLRYVIGDVAVVGPAECPCGNPLPTLARIQGRLTAQFRTAEGTLVYGGFFTRLFIRRDWVKSFRIVQTAFDHVEIYVVADGAIPESDKTEIERDIRHVMGASCTILWYPVDDIPKSKSGKNMYVISRI